MEFYLSSTSESQLAHFTCLLIIIKLKWGMNKGAGKEVFCYNVYTFHFSAAWKLCVHHIQLRMDVLLFLLFTSRPALCQGFTCSLCTNLVVLSFTFIVESSILIVHSLIYPRVLSEMSLGISHAMSVITGL